MLKLKKASKYPSITSIFLHENELSHDKFIIDLTFESPFPFKPVPGLVVHDLIGNPIFGSNTRMHPMQNEIPSTKKGKFRFESYFPLHSGKYAISLFLGDFYNDYDKKVNVMQFKYISKRPVTHCPPPTQIGSLNILGKWKLLPSK